MREQVGQAHPGSRLAQCGKSFPPLSIPGKNRHGPMLLTYAFTVSYAMAVSLDFHTAQVGLAI